MAFATLHAHKFRSFLTVLGVVIGTVTVMVIASFISGLDQKFKHDIESFGTNTVFIYKFDPGIRTGCKVAVVDATGKLLETTTIYPHEPRNDWQGSLATLARQAARMARHLAEGEALPSPRESSPWLGVVYVIAGLIGFVLLTSLINLVAVWFAR